MGIIAVVATVGGLTALFYFVNGTIRPIHVACVGDSITQDTTYPKDLQMMLGFSYTVGNFGVGGSTVSLDFRKPYIKQTEFQDAIKFSPNIVVIMLGTNDAYLTPQERANFTSDYKILVASFESLSTKPRIFVVIPPPVFNNTMGLNATILENEVIPLIKQAAKTLGVPTIDAHTPLVDHPEDFRDGIHPNDEGAKVIATQIFNAIT